MHNNTNICDLLFALTQKKRFKRCITRYSRRMSEKIILEPTVIIEAASQPTTTPILASERLQRESLMDIIQNYLTYYATGQSHTARAKRYDLQHFITFLAGSPSRVSLVTVEEWTLQKTKDFVDDRLSRGEAPTTVSRRLATIKHFGRTLAERVHGYINPAREVKSPVVQASKPHGLNNEDVLLLRQAALNACEAQKNSFTSIRNAMLLDMLLATGLRADEVRLLIASQFNDDLEWIKNVKTKGRKFRNVYIDSVVRQPLADYLQKRDEYLAHRHPEYNQLSIPEKIRFPVFVSSYKADINDPKSFGLSPKSIWRIISDCGKQACALSADPTAAVARLHPHRLRHTFAHGLLDSSKDIRLVAQALGHSDVRTTMRYTERSDELIAAAIEKKRDDTKKQS